MALFILSIYSLVLIYIAYLDFRKKQDLNHFLVANRTSGAFQTGFSITASCIGGTATIGLVADVAKNGFPAIWYLLSGAIGLMILALFFAKIVRRTEALTLPQIMEKYISKKAATLAAIIISLAWTAILAAQFSAAASILEVFGISNISALISAVFLIAIYTALGGQMSVIKSDVYQYLILLLSFILSLIFLFSKTDFNYLTSIDWHLTNSNFGINSIFYYLIFVGISYIIDPMLFSRILSARDEKTAVKGAVLGAAFIALSAFLIVLIAFLTINISSSEINPNSLLTHTLFYELPPILGIILLLGLLSAIISSADTVLITSTSVFAHDIIKTNNLIFYRISTIFFAAIALFLATKGKAILDYFFAANDLFVGGVAIPLFFALICQGKINKTCVLLAMIAGSGLGALSALGAILDAGGIFDKKIYSTFGIVLAVLFCIIGKLLFHLTRKNSNLIAEKV
ncbi:MAG: hypothetical protein J6M05_05150 [Cardiobacteriaceae bacterium]|nr:hypothetical protein [Cardiobacteriaceae bacterium]